MGVSLLAFTTVKGPLDLIVNVKTKPEWTVGPISAEGDWMTRVSSSSLPAYWAELAEHRGETGELRTRDQEKRMIKAE